MIYSKERRGEVLAACDAGQRTREVALAFGVSGSWVRRVKQERRELAKFAPWTEQHPAPALPPVDVVVMDNPSAHQVQDVVEVIEAVGEEVRYLPPNSPDLIPIELDFRKF